MPLNKENKQTYARRIHTNTMNNKRRGKTSSKKYTSHFIVRFACERELETEQRLQHNDLTSPSGHSRVSFSFSWCSTGSPGAQLSADFLYHISSPTHLISNSIGGSEGPLPRAVAFLTTSWLQLVWTPTPWLPVYTELYNSSIAHSIAHSIFGMACLIVIKRKWLSCSSEVTLFRCISLWVYHGLLPCPISSAKSTYAISFDYWPLECVTSFRCMTLEWHVWPGRRSIYNTMVSES